MSSIFGGSYPPGCNSVPDDDREGCGVCEGKKYLISERDDGRLAVERCDTCQDPATFNDEQAAVLARLDGVRCSLTYPCVLITDPKPTPEEVLREFINDIECVGVDQVASEWPDLVFTYRHARQALGLEPMETEELVDRATIEAQL